LSKKTFTAIKLICLSVFLVLILSQCSTKKDGLTKRIFHNTTAKYNGFFNAKEAKKEALVSLEESQEDDYDSLLTIFFYPTEENVSLILENMERVVEKTEFVIDKHEMKVSKREKRSMKKPEMNKWIDDNWLLMGQAYFYERNYLKAEEIFLYVKRKYETKETRALANLWLVRTYIALGEKSDVKEYMEQLSSMRTFPEEYRAEYNLVLADFAVQQNKLQDAALYLENAILFTDKKKDKARPTFILAQVYQKLGKSNESIDAYKRVLKFKPSYEMSFYSQINQAIAFKRRNGNSQVIKDKLNKMLRDEKNLEYFDQIYYALAELEIEERNLPIGIALLDKSLEVNDGNTKQRAKSFLKLADINFDERNYENAQQYYDSTTSFIQETHPRFKDITNKAASLTELVTNLRIIEREDSLLQLASLSEEDLTKRIEEIMEEDARKREEERQRILDALESGDEITSVGDFWPWNPTLKISGKTNFADVWGERELEDDWRRKNKQSFGTTTEEIVEQEELISEEIEEGRPFEEYLADIPNSPELVSVSIEKRAEARYNAGLIYKEKLDDFENAVESFEVLVTEGEESTFHPVTHYQLYRTYLSKEQGGYANPFCETCNSAHWAAQTKSRYPDSEYTILIDNPEFQSIKEIREAEEVEAYEILFDKYRRALFNDVIQDATAVINNEEENHLLPKYYLIKALAIGEMSSMFGGDPEAYKSALEITVSNYKETEEGKTAQRYLDILSGKITKEEPKSRPNLYSFRSGMGHYVITLVPLEGGKVNKAQSDIANFNATFFKSSSLNVKTRVLGKEYQMIYVRDFENEDSAMNYYNAFKVNQNILGDLNQLNYYTFAISKSNFSALTKDRDPEKYNEFFQEKYLK
tara:strand:- start:12654 stop:15272 length:2619 start_codon:yes stop_codon:yes gene_type:complete